MKYKKIAVVGASGLVGTQFLRALEDYGMSEHEYVLFASAKSAGAQKTLFDKPHTIKELGEQSFDEGFDLALFSAGASVSARFAPHAVKNGCVVIDNSSAFRMHGDVPLIVPEVNFEDAKNHRGIIANPNCSTIQAVVAIAPIHRRYGIERVVFSTYQSVSGAGVEGVKDLENGVVSYVNGDSFTPRKFPFPIFSNCIPSIDVLLDDGDTKEERKMIDETRKILGDNDIRISATCVRVPVFRGHCVSVNLQTREPFEISELKKLVTEYEGIIYSDNPHAVSECVGCDSVFVSRLRRDTSIENGLNMWVVADNLRKGAAGNAVQTAKMLIERGMI